jgi:SnoaL-like domain
MSADRLDDRAAILDVLVRYAYGLDRRDFDMVLDCFDKDASAEYAGEVLAPGADAIIRYARERLPAFRSTMHVITNVTVDFGGHDLATTECYCTAYLVQAADSGERVLIRGLRYVDQFVRRDGRWRITDRRHLPQWMAALPTVPLA